MTKVDLKDAYLTVHMARSAQRLLGFRWQGVHHRFRALPFGLAPVPRIFTKLLQPVVVVLRQMGVRLIIYLDDILILGRSAAECLQATVTLLQLLYCLGFVVSLEKSVLISTQELEFLGFLIISCRVV